MLPAATRGRLRLAAFAAPAAAALGAGAFFGSDRLEARNDFCNACHLPSGARLHRGIRLDFDARPPASLSALHAGAAVGGRGDGAFRCIDCHGGTGALGRIRAKVLAAKDLFWYAVGRFEEPETMRWPLWDADCRKCHGSFAAAGGDGAGPPAFHALPVHNTALGVRCVECHGVHDAGGNPGAYFLHASHVRGQCARCHSEFEEEVQ